MGVLHSVVLLDECCTTWLDDEGVSYPKPAAPPRFPTPREVTQVLEELEGHACEISADISSGEWSAHITSLSESGAWAFLRVSDYSSEDKPHGFYFPKGWPEVIFTVVERLSHRCGPLVVVNDSDVIPIVVCPNDSIEDLLRRAEGGETA